MVFDLRGALLRKEERESARLAEFAFRLRARTFRALAERLALDPVEVAGWTAEGDDAAVLERLAQTTGEPAEPLYRQYLDCEAAVRAALIAEVGDPAPYRLA